LIPVMRIALIAVAALCVIYFGDALVLRLMHQPYGVVQVRRYYAMPLKGNKTEYGDAGVENDTCVHALFPHGGFAPCWYASRKKEKRVTE
jgi:hypothetical protein